MFSALAPEDKQESQTNSQVSDPRSRTNSLRNGETNKVIKNVDLECLPMEKEDFEDYMMFCKMKQQSAETAPRKLSAEFFKEESKRLEQEL